MKKIVTAILLLSLALSISGMCKLTRPIEFEQFKEVTKKVGIAYLKSHAIDFFCVAAHEAGHLVLGKALCGWKLNRVKFKPSTIPLFHTASVNLAITEEDIIGMRPAAMLAVGPICGIAAALLLLKASNVCIELEKSWDLGAFSRGLQRQFLNPEQDPVLQGTALWQIFFNLANLYPEKGNDGDRICKSFKITHPTYRWASFILLSASWPLLLNWWYTAQTGSNILDLAEEIVLLIHQRLKSARVCEK